MGPGLAATVGWNSVKQLKIFSRAFTFSHAVKRFLRAETVSLSTHTLRTTMAETSQPLSVENPCMTRRARTELVTLGHRMNVYLEEVVDLALQLLPAAPAGANVQDAACCVFNWQALRRPATRALYDGNRTCRRR